MEREGEASQELIEMKLLHLIWNWNRIIYFENWGRFYVQIQTTDLTDDWTHPGPQFRGKKRLISASPRAALLPLSTRYSTFSQVLFGCFSIFFIQLRDWTHNFVLKFIIKFIRRRYSHLNLFLELMTFQYNNRINLFYFILILFVLNFD